MRKALALFLIVLIILSGFYVFTYFSVIKESDNVTITSFNETGDKSAAEKISVDFSYNLNNRLKWNSTLSFGEENSLKSNFIFSRNFINGDEEDEINEIVFYTVSGYSSNGENYDYKHGKEFEGLERAYKELYDIAVPHENTSKIIRYKDYEEFYIMDGEIHANGEWLGFGSMLFSYSHNDKEASEKLKSFFRIHVLDDEKIEVSIIIDDDGSVVSKSSSYVYDDGDTFNIYSKCSEGKNGIYLIFSNRTKNGNIIDTSLIPGGYGIYFFPFAKKGVDLDSIRNVYPVNEEVELYDISMNEDKSKIHLITRESNCLYLNVLDATNMTLIQKLQIRQGVTNEQVEATLIKSTEDFLVYHVYDNEYYLNVVEIDEKGKYSLSFSTPDDLGVGHQSDCQWDGEKLYFAFYKTDYGQFRGTTGSIKVVILDRDGVVFEGDYTTSLNTGEEESYMSTYYVYRDQSYATVNFVK